MSGGRCVAVETKLNIYDAGVYVCQAGYRFLEDLDPGTIVTVFVKKDVNEIPYLGSDVLELRFETGNARKFALTNVAVRFNADQDISYNNWTIELGAEIP